ncbi:hypothetical protein LJR045_002370 [Microbacterium sp. LjRoot45]|uniref:Uncharacterized protein n=1 Tax=Candidatus Microbacterium phytovorans TaxID=3121374 RepID=A0AAJ5W0A1_9MICO|nr:hypothetical protein [Microbacterium sp.]WEK12538.1 MAG: hypothetical protein P0Y48_08610 [Microbacterium sp.]
MDLLNIVLAIAGYAIGMVILFFVIKEAVLAALREHTLNSTTAVMIRQSVPLEVTRSNAE